MSNRRNNWGLAGMMTRARAAALSNTTLALMVLCLLAVSVWSALVFLKSPEPAVIAVTGMNSGSGSVTFCVNTAPSLNVSNCSSTANATVLYNCTVSASDANPSTSFTYIDNTTLFNISSSGGVTFTPSVSSAGYYHIAINISDGSGCSNQVTSSVLPLNITSDCAANEPPVLNVSASFSVDRNATLVIDINASDPEGDAINFSIAFNQTDAYASLSPVGGSYVTLNASSGLLTITPDLKHVGYHLLNITAQDNNTCANNTDSQLINITILPTNSKPFYVTSAGTLNYTWDEDHNIINAYDLDDFFNDSNGDCLKFELRSISANPFVSVSIENNRDPRQGVCPSSHFISFAVEANAFGRQRVSIEANDTIAASDAIIFDLNVNNLPEASTPAAVVGGGGGGGGGGSSKRCEEKWFCSGWGLCGSGYAARNCSDLNECKTGRYTPNLTRQCNAGDYCFDGRQDYDEQGVDCGGSCENSCATCFDAVMNCPRAENGTTLCEQGVDCGGPCRSCRQEEIVAPTEVPKLAPPELYGGVEWGLIISSLSALLFLGVLGWLHHKKPFRQRISAALQPLRAFIHRRLAAKQGKPSKLRLLLSRLFPSSAHPALNVLTRQAPDITARLSLLSSQIAREEPTLALKQLDTIMKDWLKHHLSIEYEATYEELGKAAREKKLHDFLQKSVEPFFSQLTELAYSGGAVSRGRVEALLHEATQLARLKPVRVFRPRQGVAVAMALLLLFAGAFFFLQDAPLTGFLVRENATFTVPVGQTFAFPASYELFPGQRSLSSLTLTGTLSSGAHARVLAGTQVVFDSASRPLSRVKTDTRKSLSPGERAIDLDLDYHAGTAWDPDDDGVVDSGGVVDLTVEGSQLGWEADPKNLCAIYTVRALETQERVCYGGAGCCALYDLAAERDTYDDTFFLSEGKLGAGSENIVTAKIAYANYSFSAEDSYFELVESEEENISVVFEPSERRFVDVCDETCRLSTPVSGTLSIEVQNGTFVLESVSYGSSLVFNRAPAFRDLPNLSLDYGAVTQLRLGDFATDADGDTLSYSWYSVDGIDVEIVDGVALVSAQPGFSGTAFTFFTASDTEQSSLSNLISIQVKQPKDVNVQGAARVGQPVRWTKIASVRGATVTLDHVPLNFTVRELTASGVRELEKTDYALKEGPSRVVAGAARAPAELQVVTASPEVEVEYYTESPRSTEEQLSESTKRVTISSELHYLNITAFTELPEVPVDAIHLYHVVGGAREEATFDAFDRNNNGLIDSIEWQVPHLSNETYEVELSILNVQSYPTVGGEWEVRFTTLGAADLSIAASNGTTYGSSGDLMPETLTCGDAEIPFLQSGNLATVSNYSCNTTATWTAQVLTAGSHHQRFTFGSAEAYAHNFASVNSSGANLSVYDSQDVDGLAKYSVTNLTFYANYTNGTAISGICTIQFNFTGAYEGAANMTFSEAGGLYSYNRTIPYKGRSYFNVLCANATSPTLNITDDLLINNSAPAFNKTGNNLEPLVCTEDLDCKYNISHYSSDVNINDGLAFDYTAGSIQNFTSHPDCSNCWRFDFTNGNFTVRVTTSNFSNSGPFRPLVTVSDTSGDSDSANIDLTITAVNDLPVFSTPAGTSISSATTETLYGYQLAASDEETAAASLVYNFSIVSCQQNYLSDCAALTLAINSTTGAFNFTPLNNDAGNYTLNLTVRDTDNGMGYKLANFTVTDINNAPSFDATCSNSTAIEDIRHFCIINGTDSELDTLTLSSNLSWFNISRTTSRSFLANFTPSNAQVGNYSVRLNLSDGLLHALTTINITVNNTNDAPVFTTLASQTAIIGRNSTFTVIAADDDFSQPYDSFLNTSENLTFAVNQSFFTLTKLNATALRLNFTPVLAQAGNYTVLVNATDIALALGFTTFNLSVRTNSAPVFGLICSNFTVIQEGAQFSCLFNASDAENDAVNFTSNTSWFNLSAAGNASFFPNDDRVGDHRVLVTATDFWGDATTYVYNVTVNNTPEAPTFTLVPNLTATRGTPFTYNLSRNVTDDDFNLPTPDTLNFSDNTTLFNITSAGFISFTPTITEVGNYTVNITVNDSNGLAVYAALRVEVLNINTAPTFVYLCENERTAWEDILFTCTINATDAESDAVNFTANASWFTIKNMSIRGAVANFTLNYTFVGNYSINFTASDYELNTSQTINFTVNNTNDAPTLTLSDLNATEDSLFNYTVNATDEDFLVPSNDTLTYRTNSTLFTINASTGRILFTPNSTQVGNHTVQFNVTDLANVTTNKTVNFQVQFFNDVPSVSVPNLEAEALQTLLYDVNATDEEDGEPNLTYGFNLSAPFAINRSTGMMNVTVNSSFVGLHVVNLSVNDSGGKSASVLFNLTILSVNSPPNLTQLTPYGTPLSNTTVFAWANLSSFTLNRTSINVSENATVPFNVSVNDSNGDNVTYRWYIDGVLNSTSNTTSALTYVPDFLDAGLHNVTVIISDPRNANATFTWNITVADSNRAPRFGFVDHDATDFSSGTANGTNTSDTGILLGANGSVFNNRGEYLSPALDMGGTATIAYNPIGLVNLSWDAITPTGTAAVLQTRTSEDSTTWNNWSILLLNRSYLNSSGERVVSENTTYLQYRVILNTTNTNLTPNVSSVVIRHRIPNIELDEGDSLPNWIDLDDYFSDLDTDDTLLFSVSGVTNVALSISNSTHIVSLTTTSTSAGTETAVFNATDGTDSVLSAPVTIEVTDVETTSDTDTVTVTRTRTTFKTRLRTVTEPRYLEIVAPRHVTGFSEDTVVAPIILTNNAESVLSGIKLVANTSDPTVIAWFERSAFDTLVPKQTEETRLFIKWSGTVREFDVIVSATSTDPVFTDKAIISLTGTERVAENRTQIDDHINFVRDLLQMNPECLELSELMTEAQSDIQAGQYDRARERLSFIIEGCRYLLSVPKEIDQFEPIKQRESSLYQVLSGLLLTLLFIAFLIIVWLSRRRKV
ncbi:MAG: Ig-like domain-containing protein [Nanoarchaeota archaeon]|nr:Ig-like domain-containing protein [Nanoarchaeota archaeon]